MVNGWNLVSISKLNAKGIHRASDILSVCHKAGRQLSIEFENKRRFVVTNVSNELHIACKDKRGIVIQGVSKTEVDNLHNWLHTLRGTSLNSFVLPLSEFDAIESSQLKKSARLQNLIDNEIKQYQLSLTAGNHSKDASFENFRIKRIEAKNKYKICRKSLDSKRNELKSMYAAEYKNFVNPVDLSIAEVTIEAKELDQTLNSNALQKRRLQQLQTELSQKSNDLGLINTRMGIYTTVSFGHYSRRVAS